MEETLIALSGFASISLRISSEVLEGIELELEAMLEGSV